MKVLQVCDVRDGDVARHVADLAHGLTRRGHEVRIFPGPPGDRDDASPSPGGRADRRSFGTLIRHLRRHGPFDLIHAHGASAGIVARSAALLSTAGVIYTPHTFILGGFAGRPDDVPPAGLDRLLEQFLSRFTSRIVCSSAAEYDYLAGEMRIAEHRLVLAHPAVRPEAFRSESNLREALDLPDSAKLIGLVGRLLPHRGGDIALRAVKTLRERRPEAHLVIIGTGPEEATLRALAGSLDIDAAVHWLGDRPARDHYHDLAALMCLARRIDTAYAPLEALYCGVPVVATPAGALRELFVPGLTGFFVPADDPAAVARHLGDILASDLVRPRMAASVRELRTYLELDRLLDEIEEIYFGRLSGRRSLPLGASDDHDREIMSRGTGV